MRVKRKENGNRVKLFLQQESVLNVVLPLKLRMLLMLLGNFQNSLMKAMLGLLLFQQISMKALNLC